VLDSLDVAAIRRWSLDAADALDACRREIDDLNVFPVPDGDTGTNLAITMRSAAEALAAETPITPTSALQALARGAVLGARGNSGVILAQVLRGFADAEQRNVGSVAEPALDAAALQRGFRRAVERAYEAVSQPVEGTILTVLRAAADSASASALAGGALVSVVGGALSAAHEALTRTPEQLPVLARANVVDAGGRGLIVVIETLVAVIRDAEPNHNVGPNQVVQLPRRSEPVVLRSPEIDEPDCEVQYLLEADTAPVEALRAELLQIGDAVVVAGTGDGHWNVHVHTPFLAAGRAVEAGIEAGRPYRITVTPFVIGVNTAPMTHCGHRGDCIVIAVGLIDGFAGLFADEGVLVYSSELAQRSGGDGLVELIRSAGAARVVLVVCETEYARLAEYAAAQVRDAGTDVGIVPTHAPVQALSAIAVHDDERRLGEDLVVMTEAAAATRWGEVVLADAEALTSVGPCHPGDYLGLLAGEVVMIGSSEFEVVTALLDRLLGVGAELITLIQGTGEAAMQAADVEAHLRSHAPYVEVTTLHSELPCMVIGAE